MGMEPVLGDLVSMTAESGRKMIKHLSVITA
jgi:hypothetical protein